MLQFRAIEKQVTRADGQFGPSGQHLRSAWTVRNVNSGETTRLKPWLSSASIDKLSPVFGHDLALTVSIDHLTFDHINKNDAMFDIDRLAG